MQRRESWENAGEDVEVKICVIVWYAMIYLTDRVYLY